MNEAIILQKFDICTQCGRLTMVVAGHESLRILAITGCDESLACQNLVAFGKNA